MDIPEKFSSFGANKRQEITRLVFEIAKRERLMPVEVLDRIPADCRAFAAVKAYLVARRFPEAVRRQEKVSGSFSAVEIDPASAMPLDRGENVPAPGMIYAEASVKDSPLVRRAVQKYPRAGLTLIGDYKTYTGREEFDIHAYNRRTRDLFIIQEQYDHFKPCPCSPGVVPCGYHNANLGFGCPFECTYCFLQSYANAPGIVIPENLDDFFRVFNDSRDGVRLGSGETTDSLVFDDLTGFSGRIVEHFRAFPGRVFEFKTKSDNVAGLLDVKAASNIVVGWSLNPQKVIDANEHFTASLARRLAAADRCAAHGYRTAFHFDPVIYFPGWEAVYEGLVKRLFEAVPSESIAWISVGTLRMTPSQKKVIENRFPENTILDAELLMGADGKLRYAPAERLEIYRAMLAWIRRQAAASTHVYLCMETASMWHDAGARVNWQA